MCRMAAHTTVNCEIAKLVVVRDGYHVINMSVDEKFLHDVSNPFHLPRSIFCNIFRLSQEMVLQIIDTITAKDNTPDDTGIPISRQVLIALLVYANGNYEEWPTDWDAAPEIDKIDVKKIVRRVTIAISSHMHYSFVKFPTTPAERWALIKAFGTAKNPFPGVIGVMDAFHVKITEPATQAWAFWNHRNFFSLNVQLICDADHKILYVNPRYPGASRDNTVWASSLAHTILRTAYEAGERNTWLLGDSGYNLQPWLMTPERATLPDSPEARYNEAHANARSVVDECTSALRATWRLLNSDKSIGYEPVVVANMVNVCCILHNMRRAANAPLLMEESYGLVRNQKRHRSSAVLLCAKVAKLETSVSSPALPSPTGAAEPVVPTEGSVRSGVFDARSDESSTEATPVLQQREAETVEKRRDTDSLEVEVCCIQAEGVHPEPKTTFCGPRSCDVPRKVTVPAVPVQNLLIKKVESVDDGKITTRKDELAVARSIRANLIARYFSNFRK